MTKDIFLKGFIGVFLILLLPVFTWAVVTQRIEFRKKAATTTTPVDNHVTWKTNDVKLTASNFSIKIGDNYYTVGSGSASLSVRSNPISNNNYTTLEITWNEINPSINDTIEMRMYMYFKSDGVNWWVYDIETYNANKQGDWISYKPTNTEQQFFKSPVGKSFSQPGGLAIPSNEIGKAMIQFTDLKLVPYFTPYCFPQTKEIPSDIVSYVKSDLTIDTTTYSPEVTALRNKARAYNQWVELNYPPLYGCTPCPDISICTGVECDLPSVDDQYWCSPLVAPKIPTPEPLFKTCTGATTGASCLLGTACPDCQGPSCSTATLKCVDIIGRCSNSKCVEIPPTPTPTKNPCAGKVNGSECPYVIACPECIPGPCPTQTQCVTQTGYCSNGLCVMQSTPIIYPACRASDSGKQGSCPTGYTCKAECDPTAPSDPNAGCSPRYVCQSNSASISFPNCSIRSGSPLIGCPTGYTCFNTCNPAPGMSGCAWHDVCKSTVCWNNVTSSSSGYAWKNGCKGSPPSSGLICTQALVPLTEEEETAYEQWIAYGRHVVDACNPSSIVEPTRIIPYITSTPKPTLTPTPKPTNTPTPTPKPTATPTPTTDTLAHSQAFQFDLTLSGVPDDRATGAKVRIGVLTPTTELWTQPIALTYVSGSTYVASFTLARALNPTDLYRFIVKGEKHLARKICFQTGQTGACGNTSWITVPNVNSFAVNLTKIPLEPGDVPTQDGVANASDFDKIKTIAAKASSLQTDADKLTADLNYDGVVNTFDLLLMRKSLETKSDEN